MSISPMEFPLSYQRVERRKEKRAEQLQKINHADVEDDDEEDEDELIHSDQQWYVILPHSAQFSTFLHCSCTASRESWRFFEQF